MNEKKEYSIVGKVEIGTDEYRDLIEEKNAQENRADTYMREGWKKDSEINELKKQVEELTSEINKLRGVLNHCDKEDITSIVMEIFGEK